MSLGRSAIKQMKLSQGVIDVSQGVIEEAVGDPVRSRLFAIAAARKAKWIVAGIWLAVFLGSFALDLPRRFRGRRAERERRLSAGERRVHGGARGHRAAQ